jgi:hypothetical protein
MTAFDAVRNWRASRRARGQYWAASRLASRALAGLERTHTPSRRAELLDNCARAETWLAGLHTTAFGPDWLEHEGQDMAASLNYSAHLLRLLAYVERIVATGDSEPLPEPGTELSETAWPVLAAMVTAPDRRIALLEDLYAVVEPIVGGQAAEVLWCLPSPGHCGWLTVAQMSDWRRAHTVGLLDVLGVPSRRAAETE